MDMENTIWQKVLIDWVNCLKLSKPIQRLDDLRDGIFFSNLQKVIKKSTEIEQDVLTCLFYVLNQHYPKFIIRNKSNVHISDINIEDLFYITSLLMHYTCIHDRRDVLTSPLCHHLQRTTQVCIRNFLEKAQEYSELTNESLRAIIALCETETEKNVTEQSQWLSLPFVMPVGKSPLQDILKTPSTKGGKLLEKDKEITRLKTDLELVQEEKENLEDDLKLQTERNKKLESQLNQKNLEISRLRSEVLVLESRTPPHYQDKDSRETQRILRTKVESLEQIIEQCDKENEELLEQRDAARAQVKLLESQCKTWLEKFIETDNTLQVLAEHSSEQETKYETLRNHCNELESLLDELQHKTHNNESFTEDSFHGSNRRSKNFEAVPSCEDLAHSVVDVQLKEKEKENEELKTALNKMEAEFSNLNKVNRDLEINAANLLSQNSITTEQLEKALSESACLLDENVLLKEKHSIVLLEIETLIKTNREFEIQISQFKVENAEILKSLKKVTEDCCCLSKEKVQLENEICSVTKKLEKITSAKTAQEEQFNITVHRKDLQIDKLTKEIQNLEHKNSQLQDDLQQKDSLISKLEILSSEKTVEIDELSKTKLYLTEQTSGLNNNLELLESKLKLSKNQYESLFEERTKDAAMFTKDKLNWEGQISKLTNDLQENRDEKNNLQITCDTLLNAEHNLKEELLELNSNLQQTIKQKEILQNEFKSNEIQKDQEINILTKEKNDLINEIFELNRNMNIIMTENADLNKRLVNVIEENSVNIEKIIEEKLDLHNQISELENCVQLLTDEKHSLSEQVHNLAEEKVKDLEKFEADKIILNEEMEELKIQIGDLIQDRNNVNKKLENIVQSRDKDLEIFTREKGDLDAEISELNGKLVQSIQDVQKVSSENCQLNNKLQNVVKQNEVLLEQLEDIRIKKAEDIEILTKENREFIKQISELNEKLDAFVNENVALHQKLKAVMDEKNEHVETLTNDKLELNNKVRQLIEEKNTLSHQLEELSESNSKNIETFKNEKLVLNNKICEINDTFRVLTQLGKYVEDRVINFTSHISSLTDENSCLQTEVDQTTSEKLIIEEQYHLTKENDNINNVVLDIKTKLQQVFTKAATFQEQFDNISHKLIRKVEESTNEKKILEDRISEVSHQLKFATERNQEFEIIMQDKGREIEKIANENQNLERVNCELIACSEGLRKENLCLIQQITDLNAEVQTLKKEFVNLDKEREKNHQEKLRELEQMKKDKENTRSQISALSIKVTELMDENSKMCEQLESLSNKNMINIEQCTDEKVNFSSLISKIESKLNHLTKENEHLHKLCTGKDEIIDDLEKSRQVLIDRVSELQNILEKLTNENAELTARLNDLHQQQVKIDTEISELSKEKLELSEQNLDLNKQLQEQTLNKAFLNQQFETFSNEQTKNMEELFQEKLALENKISVLSEQYQSQLGEKATEIEKLSNQILELSEQLHNLSKEKDTLSRETESNIKMLKTDFNKITKEKLDLEQKLTELTKENTINKQELLLENERILGQLNTALESLKLNDKTLAELSEEKEQQLTQIANFANQVDQLSEAKRDIVEELTNDKLALQNEISCLTSKLEEMSTEQSTCLEKMTSKQSENEKLKTLLSEADNDQKTLKQEMSELKTQIQQLITANKDNNQQLSNLEKEKQILTENLKKIEEEKKVVSNFLDLNNTELQKVIEEREKILEALEMSNKEVERVNQQKEKIILQLDSMFEDTELFKQEVEDLKKENQSSTDKIAELYKRIEERETYINDLEKTNKEIEIECQSKQTQLSNMSESIRIYEDNIDILQKEKLSFITQISDINTKFEIVTKEKLSLSEQIEKLLHEKADFSEQLDKVSQENVDYSKKLQCILKQSVEASDLLQKCDRLSEENAQLLGKITSLSNDLDAKTKEVNVLEVSSKQLKKILDEKSDILEKVTNENNNIFEIVDRLSQEKCDMAQSLEITLKELEKRSEEKSQLVQQLSDISNQYEKLSEENHTLRECLDVSKTELQKVKRERNELLESQTKIMKETENNIMLAHEFKNDLKKRIDLAENDKLNLKTQYEAEITKLKEAYTHAVTSNSRTEMEKVNLRKKIEEKNQQIAEYSQIKEAYEKLLEENSKLMTEVDTVKYKRSRDREEFVNLLKKEREEADVRGNKKVRQVRNEYEGKLEKMKEKMLKLYREEVHKEMQKVKAGQGESDFLLKTVEDLRNQLFDAEEKIHLLETELDMKKINEGRMQDCIMTLRDREPHYATIRDSVTSLRSTGHESDHWHRPSSIQLPRKVHSVVSINTCEDREMRSRNDRKIATLPRGQVTEIEETVMISRRTSINNGIPTGIGNLEMEDEDDDFNNKYLADLKAGKCTVNETGRESNINRFSELAWRNSMVPPHLKSSYPAEMQFVNPSHFKEEDIKSGNVELDDSLCRLLPNEKPRQKKDIGTTSYKKPGPPTPSKNGGRLSLQGNEVQPLREQNHRLTITPRKVTPSRIRSLFMGRTNVSRDNTENLSTTPKGTNNKRLSFFRKQK